MEKYKLTFNAVIETEVPIEKEIKLSFDEYSELVIKATDINHKERTIQVDKIDDQDSDEINQMLMSCVPDKLKTKVVSMSYTDIKLQQID